MAAESSISLDARRKAEEFLAVAGQFHLGGLPTEQRHPDTMNLSTLAQTNLPHALSILKKIETDTLAQMTRYKDSLRPLASEIVATLKAGDRVFFYGCGATGRLSLSIEYLWRFLHRDNPAMSARVQSFMSGGDLALVHSIENFEDHPEFGARQVRDIGFGAHDLLVACTEGGETPSVIGVVEEATRISSRKPFYLYCNPEEILKASVERSRRVLDNQRIRNICLYVGPMYLSGSTRLQASTALMLGAGGALMGVDTEPLHAFFEALDIGFLADFIAEESRLYATGDYLLYETNDYGITVLTDTTERAPTFSLRGFENQNDAARRPSLSMLRLPHAKDVAEAWRMILLREPATLEWAELRGAATRARLEGFDFSESAKKRRETLIAPHALHNFSIMREGGDMAFKLGRLAHRINVSGLHPLHEHIALKILLNMHSTLVMGRMERFESNVMTWVKPSNNKLIDRAIRYVQFLLEKDGDAPTSYEDVCTMLFAQMETMKADESIVLLTRDALRAIKCP